MTICKKAPPLLLLYLNHIAVQVPLLSQALFTFYLIAGSVDCYVKVSLIGVEYGKDFCILKYRVRC